MTRPLSRQSKPPRRCCSVRGCDAPHRARGYCSGHYTRLIRGADMEAPMRSRVRKPKHRASTWVNSGGYRFVQLRIGPHRFIRQVSRLVMEEQLGRHLLPGENVHHLDGDKLNDAPDNLELWGRPQPNGVRAADKIKRAIALLERHGYEVVPA